MEENPYKLARNVEPLQSPPTLPESKSQFRITRGTICRGALWAVASVLLFCLSVARRDFGGSDVIGVALAGLALYSAVLLAATAVGAVFGQINKGFLAGIFIAAAVLLALIVLLKYQHTSMLRQQHPISTLPANN